MLYVSLAAAGVGLALLCMLVVGGRRTQVAPPLSELSLQTESLPLRGRSGEPLPLHESRRQSSYKRGPLADMAGQRLIPAVATFLPATASIGPNDVAKPLEMNLSLGWYGLCESLAK